MHREYKATIKQQIDFSYCVKCVNVLAFAQSFINISTQVQHTYQTTPGVVNLSVSLASFATGIFMVGAGDVSDKLEN